MEEFKRLDRELIHKGSIIDYYKDTILVPNGNIVKWDFIGHKGAAAVVPITSEGKIVMVRQYRNALDRYTWEIPAGGLDTPEEPTKVAAKRELEEETGYKATTIEFLISVRTAVAFCNEKIDIYVALGLSKGVQNLDEDEFINVFEFSIEELMEMIFNGKIEDNKSISAILAYKAKYNV